MSGQPSGASQRRDEVLASRQAMSQKIIRQLSKLESRVLDGPQKQFLDVLADSMEEGLDNAERCALFCDNLSATSLYTHPDCVSYSALYSL